MSIIPYSHSSLTHQSILRLRGCIFPETDHPESETLHRSVAPRPRLLDGAQCARRFRVRPCALRYRGKARRAGCHPMIDRPVRHLLRVSSSQLDDPAALHPCTSQPSNLLIPSLPIPKRRSLIGVRPRPTHTLKFPDWASERAPLPLNLPTCTPVSPVACL